MHTIRERIDHAVEVFRQTSRHDIVIGLTHADWDELCALLIDDTEATHEEPRLTKGHYDGVPIVGLADGAASFVGHDYGSLHERRFPLEALEPLDLMPA